MCYVGKATKIFIAVAAALLVVGLVLGLAVFRHDRRRSPHGCTDCDGAGPRPATSADTPPPQDSGFPIGSSPAAGSPTPNNPAPPLLYAPPPPPPPALPPPASAVSPPAESPPAGPVIPPPAPGPPGPVAVL